MTIKKETVGKEITLKVAGRLDTTTAPELEAEVKGLAGDTSLILDFAELDYISSAGLRVILLAQKLVKANGSLVVKNVNDTIMEIFNITGFSDILNVQ